MPIYGETFNQAMENRAAHDAMLARTPQWGARNALGESQGTMANSQPAATGEQKGPRQGPIVGGSDLESEAKNALLSRIVGGDRFQAASAARALAAMGGGLQDYGQNAVQLTGIDENARQFDMGHLINSLNAPQTESAYNALADRQGVSRQVGIGRGQGLADYFKQAGVTGVKPQMGTPGETYNYSYGPAGQQGTATSPGARPTTPNYVSFAPDPSKKGVQPASQFAPSGQSSAYDPGRILGSKADGGLVERYMDGGLVENYAGGGMVGSASGALDIAAPTAGIKAITESYPAYLKAMARSGGKGRPMSLEAYIKAAMAAVSKKMQQRQARGAMPEAGPNPVMGFAGGGPVDVGGKLLDGPGHGRSDSIPALVDGQQPAAVSKGEFVVPKHVVEYFGTKHFDALLEKARMAMKKGKAAGA